MHFVWPFWQYRISVAFGFEDKIELPAAIEIFIYVRVYVHLCSMCPGVDSVSKNEYQDISGGKDGRCVRVMTLPPSCAECLEILEP
jgi:hypothetical protein